METKFQTSFIPKKPLISPNVMMQRAPRRLVSVFIIFAVIVFIISLAGLGGAYLWKGYLTSSQVNFKQQLADREKLFDINLITQLKQANVQIDTARQLLDSHVAMSQIFGIISQFTTVSSRFLSMDLTTKDTQSNSNGVKISMKGYGKDLSSVAFQSDVLGKLEEIGLRNIVKNPILSDPSRDEDGKVTFGFTATIEPSSLSYKKSVLGSPTASSTDQASTTNQ